ncbi:MAG: TonB-dependent receptor, partial [Acidobacteria bacterium]
MLLATPAPVAAQATISTGSIQGTILDQQGAVVSSAKVTITNKAIGQKIRPVVTSTGTYNSGALLPGDYVVRVEATGFRTLELPVTVLVGVISSGNVTLQVGSEATVVTVESSAVQVNTEQAAVQGVMDLAQLEPGVQIQDGGNFDPTKNGFSSISFAGRFGRTARIEVDGIDISDETVGTTTQNIPQVAIKEFQISQSTLDLSTELTSSGAVNVVTHSGTNSFHGEGFFYGRSDQISARFAPKQLDFGRKQYGVRFGGPFIKEKLFFLGAWERTQQDLAAPVTLSKPFDVLTGNFNSPFRDNQFLGRLDYQIKPGWTVFYRFSYEQNRNVS